MSIRIIKMNRGDSCELNIKVFSSMDSSKPYYLTAADAVYFALLNPHQRFEEAILFKGYTGGRNFGIFRYKH